MKMIRVNASKSYRIIIDQGILSGIGSLVRDALGMKKGKKRAVIVSDDNVYPLYGEIVKNSLNEYNIDTESFVFPHGEKSKTLETYGELLEFMCEKRITRSDFIVALGGGVVGDLAGFAAATYQRGIKFVQVPTTLLAAVDSSVGGKTAVDLKSGKNQVGAFYQPSLVVCDTDTLKTLPEDQFQCGMAEVIKAAVIDNKTLYNNLMEKDAKEQIEYVIETCVKFKASIVERDEFDTGERMLLNLGHSFGHAVEACSGYEILHGMAVSMGLITMAKASCAKEYCKQELVDQIDAILEKYGLPREIPYSVDELADAMFTDKKMAGSVMRLIVPVEMGQCGILDVPAAELADWLRCGGVK